MRFFLKVMDMIGGLDNIKKIANGKRTYITSMALILLSAGWLIYSFYLWSEKQIDVDAFITTATVCGGFIISGWKDVFQRSATAKVEAKVDALAEKPQCNIPLGS